MWIKEALKNNGRILALSPMADMTDSAFCQTIRDIGGADIVFREMVSSEAIIRESEKTIGMTDFVKAERPIVQQIFGADPITMAKAAEIVMEHANPEGIDINMGCPVYKITSNFNGSALMKDPSLAAKIVSEMKQAIGETPLSVKIRLGWDDPDTFKTFIPVLEKAGADLVTMHGRTKAQGYSGKSDWERIRQAKEIASVPFLANGDIHLPEQTSEALEQTKADGVLIARGALGNPWYFKQVLEPEFVVTPEERVRVVLAHAALHIDQYGERGIMTFRKHAAWYFKTNKLGFDLPGVKEIRSRLVRITSLEELKMILSDFLKLCKN
jgi:tRNA-dihydrouridine synthase B